MASLVPADQRELADERELAERLASARRAGVPVALTGGGGGESVDGVEIVSLGVPTFRGIAALEPEEGRVTVRAGTRLSELVRELASAGQWLPPAASGMGSGDPGGPRGSVGGLVARAAPGPFDSAYGGVRRHLLSAWTVTHAGRPLRWGRGVMKDVAGYDVKALWCGSRGRLGALARITLRSWGMPEERRVYRFGAEASATPAAAGAPGLVEAAAALAEAAAALAWDPAAAPVRPDGVRFGWSPGQGAALEVWLLGSVASVEERAAPLARWARERRLREPMVESGFPPEALAAGGPVTGHPRRAADGVLRLRVQAHALPDVLEALRRSVGEAAWGFEALPASAALWMGYARERLPRGGLAAWLAEVDRSHEESPPVAIERGGPADHAAADERRAANVRALEEALIEALDGRPRHWSGDYL